MPGIWGRSPVSVPCCPPANRSAASSTNRCCWLRRSGATVRAAGGNAEGNGFAEHRPRLIRTFLDGHCRTASDAPISCRPGSLWASSAISHHVIRSEYSSAIASSTPKTRTYSARSGTSRKRLLKRTRRVTRSKSESGCAAKFRRRSHGLERLRRSGSRCGTDGKQRLTCVATGDRANRESAGLACFTCPDARTMLVGDFAFGLSDVAAVRRQDGNSRCCRTEQRTQHLSRCTWLCNRKSVRVSSCWRHFVNVWQATHSTTRCIRTAPAVHSLSRMRCSSLLRLRICRPPICPTLVAESGFRKSPRAVYFFDGLWLRLLKPYVDAAVYIRPEALTRETPKRAVHLAVTAANCRHWRLLPSSHAGSGLRNQ